jgi:LmbE family N-acetylglucosaminyl deacetylase
VLRCRQRSIRDVYFEGTGVPIVSLGAFVRTQIIVIGWLWGVLVFSATAADQRSLTLDVGSGERLLIVAPHPDDGVIAAGGLAQRVLKGGGSVWIALVTGGDGFLPAIAKEAGKSPPSPAACIAYGKKRLKEDRAAWRRIGGGRSRLRFLGFPDGGLKGLLHEHWSPSSPECSKTTGACDPPYDEAVDPDAPYCGANLREALIKLFREANPTIVALPDPLDQHPDHRTSGLFTLFAMAEMRRREPNVRREMPRLLAYLVHWSGWPLDSGGRGLSQDERRPLDLPTDFPARGLARTSFLLTDAEMATKRAAIALFESQQKWMPTLLAAFAGRAEPFTVFTDREVNETARLVNESIAEVETHPDQTAKRGH